MAACWRGFAGATADAFTLFERLEAKLEQHPGQLTRACVELAKDWRTDRYLRRLEAMMAVADKNVSLVLTGTGDVLEPEDGLIGIGSGGSYALAAARALVDRRRPRCAHHRRARDEDRRRHLRLHQRQHRDRTIEALRVPTMTSFSPREIVSELDRYIVGQHAAKRAVAVALRNRWRRLQLRRGAARGSAAQEHPDDRPDRLRQDRDRAAARAAGRRRRSSRSKRRNSPRSAMSAATSSRSCATCSRPRSS